MGIIIHLAYLYR